MSNAHLPATLATWLVDHHGVVTTATLRHHDVGRVAQARLVDAGVLKPIVRGVLVSATAAATLEHRCRVLCCSHPDGFVTGPTAGMLAGLRRQPIAGLHFSTRHGRRLDPLGGVRFRQTTKIVRGDRHRRRDGIVVASWSRLAFDLAADLGQLDHRSVVHQMLDRRLVEPRDLLAIGVRLCYPTRPGSKVFERTLADIADVRPQDSHAEVVLRDALIARGIPVDTQVEVRVGASALSFHLDLGVPAARWGVELDIHPEHRSVDGHARDTSRARILHATEWQIEPVSELDMLDLPRLATELALLYQARRAAVRGLGDDPGRSPGLACA